MKFWRSPFAVNGGRQVMSEPRQFPEFVLTENEE